MKVLRLDRGTIEAHFALYLKYIGLSCGTVMSYEQKLLLLVCFVLKVNNVMKQ